MPAETLCAYPGRDEALVSFLYDDLTGPERSAFDTHLALCARCRLDVAQLRDVREQLGTWTVASRQSSVGSLSRQSGGLGLQSDGLGLQSDGLSLQSPAIVRRAWWREIPVWAQVAAALLCLGIGAGLANLDIRYDQAGLSIRTGWLASPRNPAANVARGADAAGAFATAAPWRADLTALERQLRTEFHSADTTPPVVALARTPQPSMSDAELLKRVRALVDESERRQNRELALRVGEIALNVKTQRQADLRKIDQSLGLIQSNTGVEVMKQRQLLNYLVRVSSQK